MQMATLVHLGPQVASPSPDSQLDERRRLKELSDERSSQWPNTLSVSLLGARPRSGEGEMLNDGVDKTPLATMCAQAQRARKEKARQERLAAEEAERVEVKPSCSVSCSPQGLLQPCLHTCARGCVDAYMTGCTILQHHSGLAG